MKLTVYIISILILSSGFVYGILGSLGTAVSYKFEIEDPIVGTEIKRLPPIKQESAFDQLEKQRIQLEWRALFFYVVIIVSIIGLVLVFVYRKQILRNQQY